VNKIENLIGIRKEEMTDLTTTLQSDRSLDSGPCYHGTKADLKPGDLFLN
jgi:hypothetical protein